MNDEQFEELKQYEWDKFCRRYPLIIGKGLRSRLLRFFNEGRMLYLIWENGFLQGCLHERKSKE